MASGNSWFAASRPASALALLGLVAPLMMAGPALARVWYVDGVNGHAGGPGTKAAPIRAFGAAIAAARPGDTIYLVPSTTYSTLWVTAGGTSGAPIKIAGSGVAGDRTKISGGGRSFGIWIGKPYVTVESLDITAPGKFSAVQIPQGVHHVEIRHNTIHDSGGDGISSVGNDYMTIAYNTVYKNATYTASDVFGSGISIKGAYDIDISTAVKNRIIGNIVYANTNVPTCSTVACFASAGDSDGNGIIIDNDRRTYSDNIPYHGRTLIANNVVFGNGGRGIHLYLSDHILITENSTYFNNQDPYEGNYRPGEITGDYVSDVDIYNNILDSDGDVGIDNGKRTGTHVPIAFMYCSGTTGITIESNLAYRPENDPANFVITRSNTVPVVVKQNYWGNPDYNNPSLVPATADFRVSTGSPALLHGLASESLATDILGDPRVAPTTIGAYELAVP